MSYHAGCLLALFQAITLSVALILQRGTAIIPVNAAMDGFIVSIIILLQLLTTRRSRTVQTESIVAEPRFNKKILKLSARIMLLLCFFVTPFIIIFNLTRYIDQDKLNDNHKYLNILIWAMMKICNHDKDMSSNERRHWLDII